MATRRLDTQLFQLLFSIFLKASTAPISADKHPNERLHYGLYELPVNFGRTKERCSHYVTTDTSA